MSENLLHNIGVIYSTLVDTLVFLICIKTMKIKQHLQRAKTFDRLRDFIILNYNLFIRFSIAIRTLITLIIKTHKYVLAPRLIEVDHEVKSKSIVTLVLTLLKRNNNVAINTIPVPTYLRQHFESTTSTEYYRAVQ